VIAWDGYLLFHFQKCFSTLGSSQFVLHLCNKCTLILLMYFYCIMVNNIFQPVMWPYTKAKNTHSKYVILNAFPLQQWMHESGSMLGYISVHCPSCVLNFDERCRGTVGLYYIVFPRSFPSSYLIQSVSGFSKCKQIYVVKRGISYVCLCVI
jgi:hypothetical protein